MPTVNPGAHVAAIARQYPSTIKVFQRHRIDFCCGGKRSLVAACSELDLPQDAVLAEVQAAADGPQPAGDWVGAPLPELVAHVVERYHATLRRDLPVLRELAAKVAQRHGGDTPALLAIREVVEELAAEMTSHMAKEEGVLFPLIVRLAIDAGAGPMPMPVDAPVRAMEHEHEEVAGMLRLLRELTHGYTPPASACNSYRGLYQMLAELEAETEAHIHLENNVLFPRAASLVSGAMVAAAG
ncbi:MAG TPA: iron-sulfur cluster repair di-iron protein [Thermoanaerobaculia bacterium]|jgi:regulator of cell morphogenesis and NO signaling|nr:iron-sulfur cluster repair di-iron protein [Thermoanaerobaculia bacterium]